MSNKKEDYFIYSHHNPDIKTMGQLVSSKDSIATDLSIPQLLIYQDENNKLNLDNLISLYDDDESNANGTGTFDKLIDKVRNTKPSQEENLTQITNNTNAEGIVSIETPTKDLSSIITPKNSDKLNKILYDKEDIVLYGPNLFDNTTLYFTHNYSANQLFHIGKLYSEQVKLLFKKFIYRVEIETDYLVYITDSLRTEAQQKVEIDKGESKSKFSYHLVGLALDINLFPKLSNGTSKITKKSSISEWLKSGVIHIANDLGLIWGGGFTNVLPDPVHFDAQNYFNVNKQKYLDSIGEGTNTPSQESSDSNTTYLDLPIKIGTVLALPLKDIDRNILATETNQTVNSTTFNSFLAKQLVDLLSSPGYVKTFDNKSGAFKGDVKEIYPYISVWVWSRALSISSTNEDSTQDKAANYQHRIINVTPYISSLNTSVAENGGNFNMNLAAINADIRVANTSENSFMGKGWKVKEGTQKAAALNSGDYINQSYIHYVDKELLKRNRMYFEKSIQAQDIVFIRFERLILENKRQNLDELETISINDLPNQVFDMIALVDNVQQTTNFADNSVDITISGRDLVKLIIEDGVYLYPASFTADGIFSNAGPTGSGATNSRLFRFDGNYLSKFTTLNRTIDRSLKWIINNLGTIEICPQDLFDGYKNCKENISDDQNAKTVDKRSKAYQLTDDQKTALTEQQGSDNDDQQKILDSIANIQKKNGLENASSQDAFNNIKDFLKDRINNKEITVLNQKIQSWKNTELDKKEYVNKLPSSIDDSLIISDRSWFVVKAGKVESDTKFDLIITPSLFPAIGVIETIYKRVTLTNSDKTSLKLTSVDSIKELSRIDHNQFQGDRFFINNIPLEQFISDITEYVGTPSEDKPIFTQNDVNSLNTAYIGKKLSLGVISKKLSDLTQDEKSVFDNIYNLIIRENSQHKQEPNQSLLPLAGIWQIIKLVVDDSVKDRRCYDQSLGNENGSIINAIRKICQDPFCEFFTDTYGDQFYFIVRKKPFDQKSLLAMIDGEVTFDVPTPIDDSKDELRGSQVTTGVVDQKNLIIDIEENDVLSDSLNYSTEAYSWYRLQLKNTLVDTDWSYLKAIYFNEFADIYGSRPLDIQTNYIPYLPVVDKNAKLPAAYFIRQGIYDLKYMIECNACLPFTRMGVIVMNGDRRIKRGTFIRYKGTGEIFYVDAVSHSFSITDKNIDRTTTLQVSRGMVERFIRGVSIEGPRHHSMFPVEGEGKAGFNNTNIVDENLMSYFNICDLAIDESIFTNTDSGHTNFGKTPTAKWKVNRKVFNFFLKKLQFAKNDKEILDGLK